MRPIFKGICLVAVALLVCGAAYAEVHETSTTMEGEFVWQRDDGDHSGDLKAVFTPAGEGSWNVDFHFEWEDGPHVYSGTAEGSLSDGELKGTVENDSEERKTTFRFTGSFEDGKFHGTHGSVQEDGSLRDLGKLWLGPAS